MRYVSQTMALPAALRDVKHPKDRVKVRAAEALGQVSGPDAHDAIEALRPLLRDESPDVRFMAALSLGKLSDEGSVESLIIIMKEDGEPMPRQAAVTALGEIGDPRARDALIDALESEYPDVRFQATTSLVQVAPKAAAKPLRKALKDTDPEVRGNAAAALGDIADTKSANAVFALLEDPELPVRAESTLSLARMKDARATRPLLELVEHGDYALLAAELLFQNPVAEARDTLLKLSSSWFNSPLLKVFAAGALFKLGDPHGKKALLGLMENKKQPVRGLWIQVLGDIGQSWCRQTLETKLQSSSDGEWSSWREELMTAIEQCDPKSS